MNAAAGNIAVISAFNPDSYGMYSVDLAAEQFFRGLGLDVTHVVTQDRTRTGRLRFRLVRSAGELAAFDTIVYWGDFLNNPMWGERDYVGREIKHGASATQKAAWENWCALYLDVKRHAPHARVFALGGCFLGAGGRALAATSGRFNDFIRTAELVTPRDGHSLETVRRIEPGGRVEPGMDCAWLLRHPPARRDPRSRYFVCFLGRTLRGRDRGFLRDLGRQMGLKPVWLDWLNLQKPRFLADWRFRQMHKCIAGARFVVTDTYHLVINALNRGVPTVGLHDGGQVSQEGTLGDYKKGALMEQVGLSGLLLDVGDGVDLATRIRERIGSADGAGLAVAMADFLRRRDAYARRLHRAFTAATG